MHHGGAFTTNFQGAITSMKLNSTQFQPTSPNSYQQNMGFSSRHVGGGLFLFADGKVQFMTQNIDFATYNYLGNKADGNVVGSY